MRYLTHDRSCWLSVIFAWGVLAPLIVASPAGANCSSPIVIQQGDTLAAIARRCDFSVDALLSANPQLRNPDIVQPGDRISLPIFETAAEPGDTLVDIADRYGVPLAFLIAANPDIGSDVLEARTVVLVPAEK